jgi:FlaA1/EpsC-like NDP-sugar epimerase
MKASPRIRRWRILPTRVATDGLVVLCSMALAYWLRFEFSIPSSQLAMLWTALLLAVAIKIPVFFALRVYRFSWRNIGLGELAQTAVACILGSVTLTALTTTLSALEWAMLPTAAWRSIPRSILAIDLAFCLLGILGVRVSQRLLLQSFSPSRRRGRRALVIGAGDAGSELIRALELDDSYAVIGILDDDPCKQGQSIRGVSVLGPREMLPKEIARREIAGVLIAMPSAEPEVIRETIELVRSAGVSDIKIIPPLAELYAGIVTTASLRDVAPEDVLRREAVQVDAAGIERYVRRRTVLVTGAAGSIGTELCRQLLRFGAQRLVAVDFNETSLFYLEAELLHHFPGRDVRVMVGDVRDAAQMQRILESERPWAVYHAAAYKHVPMMEAFPCEAVKTNVQGTRNVLQAACRVGADAFVLISTDKAVHPTSVMGVSKRIAELVVCAESSSTSTRCLTVRFGNVLGSRGSVLKTFQDQVVARQPVTVTHPDMQRFFMIASEAVQLVLQAGVIGQSGQVLVLDMGAPVRIVDLAEDVIRFYGLAPHRDVPIVFTGMRPGEKLYEELFTAEEGAQATAHQRLTVATITPPDDTWLASLTDLASAAHAGDDKRVMRMLHQFVPQYGADDA